MTEMMVILPMLYFLLIIAFIVGIIYLGSYLVKFLRIKIEEAEIKKEKLQVELDEIKAKSRQ